MSIEFRPTITLSAITLMLAILGSTATVLWQGATIAERLSGQWTIAMAAIKSEHDLRVAENFAIRNALETENRSVRDTLTSTQTDVREVRGIVLKLSGGAK